MKVALTIAAKAMDMSMEKMNVISNNLANVNTVGFKKDNTYINSFQNQLASNMGTLQHPEVPKAISLYTDFKQGNFRFTGDKFNMALDGDGFIKVKMANGEDAYTRKGTFTLNKNKELMLGNSTVMGSNGIIRLKDTDISIDGSGKIYDNTGAYVDTLKIVNFEKPYPFTKVGSTLFVADSSAKEVPATAECKQQYIEESNVDALSSMIEMITMMESMRNYETQQKVVQIQDESTGKMISQIGQV